jgi:hypothetical protein
MDIRPISESEWTGLSLQDAIKKAEGIGYTWRIVEENGNAKMLEYNVRSNRVNLRLRDNFVVGVYTG